MPGSSEKRSKQTQETMDAICDAVRMGLPLKQSCKSAGISERTGRDWRERGWLEIDAANCLLWRASPSG